MNHSNITSYNSPAVLKWYKHLDTLMPAEQRVFETYREFIASSNLLDIGIGGGRTTDFLMPRCKNYTGIDYSEGFVKIVRDKHPGKEIHKIDARDLSLFSDHTFDLVNFSFNGIDYVDEKGREKILREINRVLKPGGFFFFSTHNKMHGRFAKNPWTDHSQSFITNVKTFMKLLPFLPRHFQNKKQEVRHETYAIINDCAHDYSLLTFYTSPGFLKEQLNEYGFSNIQLLSKQGLECVDEQLDEWISVTCRKSIP